MRRVRMASNLLGSEPAFEQRLAGHGRRNAGRRERGEVGRVAHAAGRMERDRRASAARSRRYSADVRARQRAVSVDVGAEHVLEPGRRVALDRGVEASASSPRPAVRRDQRRAVGAEPHVERRA